MEHTGKRALVLAGGGAKGSYQIGVWRALQELDWTPDIITGASVGTLNGCLFTMGKIQHDCRLPRPRQDGRADGHRNSGVLRIPRCVGLHDLCPLPHDPGALPAVSLFLGTDRRRRDRLFCVQLPPRHPPSAGARCAGAAVRAGERAAVICCISKKIAKTVCHVYFVYQIYRKYFLHTPLPRV